MKRPCIALLPLIVLLVVGCDDPKSATGFRLPDGDIDRGRATFVRLSCHSCHKVAGVTLPPPSADAEVVVVLGGKVHRVKTYGQLVTSIIHPSHTFAEGYSPDQIKDEEGQSKMTNFNDRMTVQELIDLVAFLQSRYKVVREDWSENTYLYP